MVGAKRFAGVSFDDRRRDGYLPDWSGGFEQMTTSGRRSSVPKRMLVERLADAVEASVLVGPQSGTLRNFRPLSGRLLGVALGEADGICSLDDACLRCGCIVLRC